MKVRYGVNGAFGRLRGMNLIFLLGFADLGVPFEVSTVVS